MTRLLLVTILAISYGDVTAAEILYSQTPNFDFGGLTSVLPLPITADDFTPTGVWEVTAATLQGAWTSDAVPPGAASRDFRIQFYADVGGVPSELPFSDVNVLATITNPHGSPLNPALTVYDIGVNFPNSVLLSPATKYWFAAVDDGPGRTGTDGFFWSSSEDGDGLLAQRDSAGWHANQENVGFALIGNAVPEPTSFWIAATGVFGWLGVVGGRRRWRSSRSCSG